MAVCQNLAISMKFENRTFISASHAKCILPLALLKGTTEWHLLNIFFLQFLIGATFFPISNYLRDPLTLPTMGLFEQPQILRGAQRTPY